MDFKIFYETMPDYVKSQLFTTKYSKNSAIVKKELLGKYLYILLEGKADVLFQNIEGTNMVLNTYHPYSVFGEVELFNEKMSTVGVFAKEDVLVALVPKRAIYQWMEEDFALTKHIISQLSDKLLATSGVFIRMFNLTIKERMVYQVYTHYVKGDLDEVSKHDMAKELNVPMRSLNRSLVDCMDQGLIEWRKKQFMILDEEAVIRYIEQLDIY